MKSGEYQRLQKLLGSSEDTKESQDGEA